MLLTVAYEGQHTQDLGYLLHKNPDRAQAFELNFGKAYVFYPEVSDGRTTAALLLDIDPIDLARGKLGGRDGVLFDYVNDRPYASTSFMSTAIARVFGTAMSGRCVKKQELADTPLCLTARPGTGSGSSGRTGRISPSAPRRASSSGTGRTCIFPAGTRTRTTGWRP